MGANYLPHKTGLDNDTLKFYYRKGLIVVEILFE